MSKNPRRTAVIWAWQTLFEFLVIEKPEIAFCAVFNIIAKSAVWDAFKTSTEMPSVSF